MSVPSQRQEGDGAINKKKWQKRGVAQLLNMLVYTYKTLKGCPIHHTSAMKGRARREVQCLRERGAETRGQLSHSRNASSLTNYSFDQLLL